MNTRHRLTLLLTLVAMLGVGTMTAYAGNPADDPEAVALLKRSMDTYAKMPTFSTEWLVCSDGRLAGARLRSAGWRRVLTAQPPSKAVRYT